MNELIIGTFALYGTTTLLAEYSGAFDILLKIRSKLSVFRCAICASVWLAIPVAVYIQTDILGYLAMIGGVLLMDRMFNL